jgi:hypothetical protein
MGKMARKPRTRFDRPFPVEVRHVCVWANLSESWRQRLTREFGATAKNTLVLSPSKVIINEPTDVVARHYLNA